MTDRGANGPAAAGDPAADADADDAEIVRPSLWKRIWEPERGSSYWLTRFVMLRLLGLVYFVAFLGAARQNVALIGQHGLLPAGHYLHWLARRDGSRWQGFLEHPSLFWLSCSNTALAVVAWTGALLSLAVLCGFANGIMFLVLWALYFSINAVGQTWYAFGWEIQLLETGFLAIFLVPLFDPRPLPERMPPRPVMWMFRWLLFRIMLGAGLIKLRGSPCWRHLTCLDYHFQTQPIPGPLSPLFHFAPHWVHELGVLFNDLVEVAAPFFIFGPRRARHIAGALMLAFQCTLILSGNLAFLNWLTIIPILACFDDSLLRRLLPRRLVGRADAARAAATTTRAQRVAVAVFAAVVVILSVQPALNLLSSHQAMNRSYDRFELVNSYGAFGSVGKKRYQLVFEGTSDHTIDAHTHWKEYELPCQPGDLNRRPCWITPYHERLDWLLWFAAMSGPRRYPWTIHMVWKLLHNDPTLLGLFAHNPFPNHPPRYVRVSRYLYWFAPLGDHAWWKRKRLGDFLPPLSASDPRLLRILRAYGWLGPDNKPPL